MPNNERAAIFDRVTHKHTLRVFDLILERNKNGRVRLQELEITLHAALARKASEISAYLRGTGPSPFNTRT